MISALHLSSFRPYCLEPDINLPVSILQQSPVDLSEKLPESLYIDDVLESASYRELPLQKLKNVTGESGASTSGSSNLAFDNKTGGI